MINKIINYVKDAVKETIALAWTLCGLGIGYFTLTGAAKDITGIAVIVTLTIWLATIRLRK